MGEKAFSPRSHAKPSQNRVRRSTDFVYVHLDPCQSFSFFVFYVRISCEMQMCRWTSGRLYASGKSMFVCGSLRLQGGDNR